MLLSPLKTAFLVSLFYASCISPVAGAPAANSTSSSVTVKAVASESVAVTNGQAVRTGAPVVPLATVQVNGVTHASNTSAINTTVVPAVAPITGSSTASTVLVIARDAASSYSAFSGLNGYGIPYFVLLVPQAGVTLPVLNSTATVGNYGAIVVLSEVSYDYGAAGGGFQSALTAAQWDTIYNYQMAFGVRMVRLDVFPGPSSGTTTSGGCCNTGVEQLVSVSNTAGFPTAGLNM